MPNVSKPNINLPQPQIHSKPESPKTKPNLKLNMKPQRSLASIANTIPNFNNNGPFSPGLFSSKRVWVKRDIGTATTVMVGQGDIIDDLKTSIIHKFPNALGKYYDSADLVIKMDLNSRTQNQPPPFNHTNNPHKKPNLYSEKPSMSPTSSTFDIKRSNYSLMTLEPDQNVWNLLDLYFPGGMSMKEALIIEIPETTEQNIQYRQESFDSSIDRKATSSANLAHLYRSSTSPVSRHYQNPSNLAPYRSITPTNNQGYFQPKPQYLNQGNLYKERSVSPSTSQNSNLKALPLPSGINLHRRSQSNPPQSPVSDSASLTSKNPNNNQAVLLLPKNFSLSSSNPEKKRLSLDENFVKKNRDIVTSPINKNLSNIKSPEEILEEETQSFPLSKPTLPKLDVTTPKDDGNLESPDTPNDVRLPSGDHDGLTLGSVPTLNKDNAPKTLAIDKPEISQNGSNGASKVVEKKRQTSGTKKPPGTSATETVLPSISVLVVEDNAINQAILGAFLRKHKIHYEIAKNGEEAITKWRKGGFHLVLMDIQLPVKSGIEATKEIRYLERINRIGVFAENEVQGIKNPNDLLDDQKLDMNVFRSPVIIVALTASSNSSVDRSNALRAGCNDYLTKPVNLVWLQNKITEWGCMQALIDFDGWKTKRSNFNGSSAKILAQKTRSRSSSIKK